MEENQPEQPKTTRYYYLDESGDGTLFGARGRVIVGQPGCSRLFVLGLLAVADPVSLSQEMDTLRQNLLADPYFQGVPSFDPRSQKTAVAFHATDDLPEVRREVFSLLRARNDLEFFAVIRDKLRVADYVLERNKRDPAYRYHPNELYDFLVRRLTRNLLHKHDEYQICFAKRGLKDRTKALMSALQTARERFERQLAIQSSPQITVLSQDSKQSAGLQAVDYFLWALQRLLVQREERYWAYVWPACKLIIDVDDQREKEYGVYYTQKRPLSLAVLDPRYFSS
jgi:hypothetical protein